MTFKLIYVSSGLDVQMSGNPLLFCILFRNIAKLYLEVHPSPHSTLLEMCLKFSQIQISFV